MWEEDDWRKVAVLLEGGWEPALANLLEVFPWEDFRAMLEEDVVWPRWLDTV